MNLMDEELNVMNLIKPFIVITMNIHIACSQIQLDSSFVGDKTLRTFGQ